MKDEYDFSAGERGKFYHPELELTAPVYLESDVLTYLSERAEAWIGRDPIEYWRERVEEYEARGDLGDEEARELARVLRELDRSIWAGDDRPIDGGAISGIADSLLGGVL